MKTKADEVEIQDEHTSSKETELDSLGQERLDLNVLLKRLKNQKDEDQSESNK